MQIVRGIQISWFNDVCDVLDVVIRSWEMAEA